MRLSSHLRSAPLTACAALAVLLCLAARTGAQSAAPPPGGQAAPEPGGRAQVPRARPRRRAGARRPVLLGGEPVVWISAGVGQYTPEVRAAPDHGTARRDRPRPVDPRPRGGRGAGWRFVGIARAGPPVDGGDRAGRADCGRLHGPPGAGSGQQVRSRDSCGARPLRARHAHPQRLAGRAALLGAALVLWAAAPRAASGAGVDRAGIQPVAAGEGRPPVPAEDRVRRAARAAGAPGLRPRHVVAVLVVLDLFLTFTLALFPWTRARRCGWRSTR